MLCLSLASVFRLSCVCKYWCSYEKTQIENCLIENTAKYFLLNSEWIVFMITLKQKETIKNMDPFDFIFFLNAKLTSRLGKRLFY